MIFLLLKRFRNSLFALLLAGAIVACERGPRSANELARLKEEQASYIRQERAEIFRAIMDCKATQIEFGYNSEPSAACRESLPEVKRMHEEIIRLHKDAIERLDDELPKTTFEVTGEDGRKFQVTGPPGATQGQANRYVLEKHY